MLACVPLTSKSTCDVCEFPDPSVTVMLPWWNPTDTPVAFTVNAMFAGVDGVTLPLLPPVNVSHPLSEFAV
jgi:hypothetical protein